MKKTLFLCVVLACLATAANATLIDFETVPENESPQAHNVYVGDTYDVLGVNLWSKSTTRPSWNYNIYNNSGWFVIGGYAGFYSGKSHIGMNFDTGMSEVSMTLFSNASIQFWVYDTDNVKILGVTSVSPYGGWAGKTITAPTGRLISRIELEGTTNGAVVGMDNLTFVPEPATMCMLAFGAVMAFRRRS